MYIDDTKAQSEEKELKVKIPVRQHLKLHSRKVLTGETISSTVAEALEQYFEDGGSTDEAEATQAPASAER